EEKIIPCILLSWCYSWLVFMGLAYDPVSQKEGFSDLIPSRTHSLECMENAMILTMLFLYSMEYPLLKETLLLGMQCSQCIHTMQKQTKFLYCLKKCKNVE